MEVWYDGGWYDGDGRMEVVLWGWYDGWYDGGGMMGVVL